MKPILRKTACSFSIPGQAVVAQPCRPLPPRFSEELRTLADRFADRPGRLSEILEATEGRGFHLLLLVIVLPFLTPVPLPGLSTPFGFVAVIIGARLAFGHRPWLPRRLLERELPARFLGRVLGASSRIVRLFEVLLRPRFDFLSRHWLFKRMSGVFILFSGMLLLLPLPIPFTNSFPALTVVLLAAGAMERDGLFFLAGCVAFTATMAYFGLLAFGGVHLVENLRRVVLGG